MSIDRVQQGRHLELLTVDEARTAVVRSAARCLQRAECPPDGRIAMLWALPGGPGWTAEDEQLAAGHRVILENVAAVGRADVIAPELLGIQSATGLDKGVFCGLETILAQLAPEGETPLAN